LKQELSYDASGKTVAEYSTMIASTNDAKVNYLTADHLGSPRINTDQSGAVTARHDYLPFGEEIFTSLTAQRTTAVGYSGDTIRKQFTGYERDTETGLDFAQARMYASFHGRFLSPDPLFLFRTAYFLHNNSTPTLMLVTIRSRQLTRMENALCRLAIRRLSICRRRSQRSRSS